MEDGLVDLVENHCGPVISGHFDQILYGPYCMFHASNISSNSQSRGGGFIFVRLLYPSVSLE